MIDFSQVTDIMLGNAPVEQVSDSRGNVLWSAAVAMKDYFYVEDISGSDNTLSIKKQGSSAPDIEVFCSSDQKNWTSMGTTSTTAITATVPANGKLYLRATANKWGASSYQYNYISASGNHNVGGNIMSLLYNEDFENQTLFPAGSTYTFFYLFKSDPNLINAENLVLPATTLTNYCYGNMFYGCTSLTQAPALPAQSVPQSAYSSMFQNCTSLATAPTLPATTLNGNCYQSMFNGCASLTQAPELPATTLATSCYNSMFKGCTALTTAPVLPATTLAPNCYSSMFNGCTSLTQAPALPAQSVPQSAYSGMFQNCTSLTQAPALPATTLNDYCYSSMFQGCTSLTTAPALSATTLAQGCYSQMFKGCTALTTAPVLPATTLAPSCYFSMFNGCTSLTQAPELPAQSVPQSAYSSMFQNCTSLTTAPELPATTLATSCYNTMFYGCTGLVTAPVLPATTLAVRCYEDMFEGCTSLTQAPALPAQSVPQSAYSGMFQNCTSLVTAPTLSATTLANYCYSQMFYGCSALTETPVLPATTLATTCYGGMFSGCTNLNSVTTYAQDISASSCLLNWLSGVAATGDFYNLGGATYTADSPSGIPTGWSEWTSLPEYFYIEDISGSDNTVSIAKSNTDSPTIEVFYSTDKQNWTSMGPTSTTAITATVPANGKLYLKTTTNAWNQNKITASGNHNVGGNIMSLLYGDNYGKQKTFPSGSTNTFRSLFVNNTNLINAENLILPATTMVQDGYRSLFYGCTGLVTAPALPATTMAQECYRSLFYNCTSLTQAPALPATTLAQGCYTYMFYNCTSLNEITTCANDISAPMCLLGWVENVAATGDFYNKGTATYTTGVSGIPTGWTLHNVGEYFYVEDISGSDNTLSIKKSDSSVPAIVIFKSTDKVNWTSMGTTSTSYIRATIPANGKLYLKATANSWGVGNSGTIITTSGNHNVGGNIMSLLYGDNYENTNLPVGNFGTFCNLFKNDTTLVNAQDLILPATTLAPGCYRYMFYGCTGLVTAPVLPATTLAVRCYEDMFEGCTSLTQAPVLSATTLDTQCYDYMFRGCTSLTTAPVLPAITLTDYCYRLMFQGCSNLNSVTTYAQDISASNCIDSWLDNVAATGDFYNMACTTYPEGASGIPSGWTEHHTTASTINVTITNTGDYTGATYQIDSGAAQPINETGTTSFTVPATATTLTIHRNGKGVTDVLGICGYSEDSHWDAEFPVNKMTDNVSVDLVNLM